MVLVLAWCGVFLNWASQNGRRQTWLLAVLAVAALLGPLEQASLHTSASLNKHTDLGAWFAAVTAGYAAGVFIAAAAGRSRLLTTAGCVLALAFPTFLASPSPGRSPPPGLTRPASWRSSGHSPRTATCSWKLLARPLLPPVGRSVAALVVHPQHHPAQRGEHWRPGPGWRHGRRRPRHLRQYLSQGYFSVVALNSTDTTALDRQIRADLTRSHYHIIEVVPLQPAGHRRYRPDRHLCHLAIQGPPQ